MADMVTKQELEAAKIDVKHAGEAVNTKKVITPRYGAPFKSLPLVAAEAQAKADEVVAQGFYRGYTTEALLLAAKPAVAEMRARADDTRKIYRWNRTSAEGVTPVTGNWVDTGLSELDQAKTYADTNKLDLSKITYEYVNGNKIGAKTPRYVNLGLTGVFAISSGTFYDSLVLRVKEGDLLFLLNDKQQYVASNGGAFAFFAEDPNVNRSQTRITDNRASATDTATALAHQKVTVPTGAKYLMLNTRYTDVGNVRTDFSWAVHVDSFKSTYTQGTEIISEVLNTPVGKTDDYKKSVIYTDSKFMNAEKLSTSGKNLFNPETVIVGSTYNNLGTLSYNAAYRRSIKYPCVAGEWISFSGMVGMGVSFQPHLQFWSGTGDTFLSLIALPAASTTTAMSVQVPVGAVAFSININSATVPTQLQIEKAQKPTTYEPYFMPAHSVSLNQADTIMPIQSTKNLYDGGILTKARLISTGVQATSSEDDVLSSFIPVEYGKYYTVSGLNLGLINTVSYLRLLAYSSNLTTSTAAGTLVKAITPTWANTFTFYVDDPAIKYILLPLVSSTHATKADALALPLQVEEGQVATSYEPSKYTQSSLNLYKASIAEAKKLTKLVQPKNYTNFIELNAVRSELTALSPFIKDLSPMGFSYAVESSNDSASNTLFAQIQFTEKGKKSIYANLMKYMGGVSALGVLNGTPFTVPSGQFDNEGTLPNYTDRYSKYDYCHPDIAYDSVGVAGFKYWMISSVLPANNAGDVIWEDEDLFVSNDAKNWQRVRSLYESDKTYTTASLRLPPQTLATANARKYAFLPCPANGDTIEISVPADNGAIALDRVNITLTGLPWKHDPAIIIDGGYVYTYHSFHLPYVDRDGGKNRFIVCVRTNDGINWEVVRTDGSTMLLTEVTSRQIFTKDAQGRYNYMYYAYSRGYSNPEVIKWGENDYELYYGENFGFRVKGTTPYSFDFGTTYPIGPTASGNHPGLLKSGNTLYLINNNAVYKSTDRGATLTKLPYYPMWLGGVSGIPYKKALCVGDGGKVILVEAQRFHMQQFSMPAENQFSATNDANFMSLYEFASVAAFEGFAQNGLVDAYIDVQLCKVNLISQKREYFVMPALSLKNTTTIVNRPLQRLKVCDMDFEQGDTLHMYVTLNSRNGAKIVFGGIDVA